jgi:hypothetical protein
MLTPTGVIESEEVDELVDKSGRLRRRPKREHGIVVTQGRNRLEEVPDHQIAVGQLVELDGEAPVKDVRTNSACRDLEALTFSDDATTEISTASVALNTMSPQSSRQHFVSLSQMGTAENTISPAPNFISTSTSPLNQITHPFRGPNGTLPHIALDKPASETASSQLIPASTPQLSTDTLLDLITPPSENEIPPHLRHAASNTMKDLAGLRFSVAEEAVVFQPRNPRAPATVNPDIADRAFRMFSMGIKAQKV